MPIHRKFAKLTPRAAKTPHKHLKAHRHRIIPATSEQGTAVLLLIWTMEKFSQIAELLPGVGNRQIAPVLLFECRLLGGVFKPVLAIDKSDGIGLAWRGVEFATAGRIFAQITRGAGMNFVYINCRGQPVGQIHVKTARRAASNPLTIANHDIKIRFIISKIEKDLILIRRPGNLVNFNGNTRFLFEFIAQFLKPIRGIPLRPPYCDRGLCRCWGFGRTAASDEKYQAK